MDAYTEAHFQSWLDRVVGYKDDPDREDERGEVEKLIRDLIKSDPELLKTHSWNEILRMVKNG